MKRKHKKYSRPKRPFEKARIMEEEEIKKEFGLKNKREIWKSESAIKSIRNKAKNIISSSTEEQKKLFEKLKNLGFGVSSISNVLSLDKKDYLRRRLQTVVVARKLAKTPKHSRHLIVHRKILIDGKVVNSPSYIVPVNLEEKITLKEPTEKPKKQGAEEKIEAVQEAAMEN